MIVRAIVFVLVCTAVGGCSYSPSGTFTESVPDRTSFPDVAQALVQHCGTLDCHGTLARNMRIFGNVGLRLSLTDMPLQPACTTSAEVDEDFASVVGLEPEVMTKVVADHGADPELLTFVRKARGTESHKGGTLMKAGDDLDICITSWLAATTRTDTCQNVAPPTVPPPAPGQVPACEPGP